MPERKTDKQTNKQTIQKRQTDREKKSTRKILQLSSVLLTSIIAGISGCQSVHKSRLEPSL